MEYVSVEVAEKIIDTLWEAMDTYWSVAQEARNKCAKLIEQNKRRFIMPNWVKTKLSFFDITDEEFQKIVDTYTTEDEYQGRKLDFENIIPMPENIYRGNLGPKEREKYGDNNWYDWSIMNWGTKWNSCNNYIDFEEHTFEFETAWSFAEPIVIQLAQQTGYSIMAKYADEDFGCNCGVAVFESDGGVCDFAITDNTDEAWDIVTELWGITREELESEESV